MLALVIVLCVLTVAACGGLMQTRRRLAEQRRLTAEADRRATEADAAKDDVADAVAEHHAADADVAEDEADADETAVDETAVDETAVDETAVDETAGELSEGGSIEGPLGAVAAPPPLTIDAGVLWAMERARSERTWRYSVSLGPDSVSVFESADDPLLTALQVEVDAAREEVGTVVYLDAVIPQGLSDEASLLTLRVAQELLAPVVRRGEQATLHVHADGRDMIVTTSAVDDEEEPIEPAPFGFSDVGSIEAIPAGARIRSVVPVADSDGGS